MTNLLQKIWLIFIVAVLVVIFFLPTSNPAYTDEEAANTLDTAPVEVISTLEPVDQPMEEVNHSTKITSVEQVSDVSASDPYFNALKKLIEVYQMRLTLADGSFQGNQFITRGDFIIYLRDSLEVMNKFQQNPKVASLTSKQIAKTAVLINDLEYKADVISQKIEQLNTRIYLLDNKVQQPEQPLLVQANLDSSLTSNQTHSDEQYLVKVNTIPEIASSTLVHPSEPEIDLFAPVNPAEELFALSDVATVNTSESNISTINTSAELVASTLVYPSEPEIDLLAPVNSAEEVFNLSDIPTINYSAEIFANTLVTPSEPEIDLLALINSTEEISDTSDVAIVNTSEEVIASNQLMYIEDIPDVSLDEPYYDALREIIENYQVDVTLPDGTFKGNQPITRSEVIIYLNDSIAAAEELIAFKEEVNNLELELSFDDLSLQIAQADSYFAEKLAQIEQIESQLDELEYRIAQNTQSHY